MPAQGIKLLTTSRVSLTKPTSISQYPELTTTQNGVGAFILPCKRLSFHYCDWAGSSKGMNAYLSPPSPPSLPSLAPASTTQPVLTTSPSPAQTFTPIPTTTPLQVPRPERHQHTNHLAALAKSYPQIEFHVSPKPRKHPVIKAEYINGRIKAICVANMNPVEIHNKARLLVESSGEKKQKIRGRNVVSMNESVRGIWSPFHGGIRDI